MFVVGLARGAERAHHAALDRGRVGRAQPDRRAELIVRVGVARIRRDALARDRRSPSRWRRGTPATVSGGGVGSGEVFGLFGTAEVVVHRHVAAAERDAQPQRRREAAVGAGVLRVGGDRLPERGQRQVVIEVVGVVRRLRPKRVRRRVGPRRRAATTARQDGADRGAGTPPSGSYYRSYAAAPPCAACAFCIQSLSLMDKTGIHPGGEHAHVHVRTATTHAITRSSGSGGSTCSRSITR